MTDFQKRCADPDDCPAETKTNIVEHSPMTCLGFYVEKIEGGTVASEFVCPGGDQGIILYEPETLDIEYRIGTGLDAGYGRFKPVSWPEDSARAAPGEIQNALQAVYRARMEYEYAVATYEGHASSVEGVAKRIQDRYEVLEHQGQLNADYGASMTALDNAIFSVQTTMKTLNYISSFFKFFANTVKECPPQNVGVAAAIPDMKREFDFKNSGCLRNS